MDAAVAVHPRFKLAKTLQWSTLRREKLMLVVPSKLRNKKPLSILSSMPLIRYDRKTEGGRLADEYIRHQGIACKVQFELDGIEQIAKLVAEGLGVAVLPDWPVTGSVNSRLARLPLPEPCPERLVGLTWFGSSKRAALVAAFLKVATEVSSKKVGRR
ncbi:MAG TPA: LysR substrate-binding domain-containing protein [Afipia sp.]